MTNFPTTSKITPNRLYGLARAGILDRQGLAEGLRFTGHQRTRAEWLQFIQIALLALGSGFLVAGIFFFFAYNWNDLHHFAKLGLVQGAILLAAGLAHHLGLDKLSGQIALTGAALLVGALLALFGQIYQSTADTYTLFLYWAIYILGWVIIGRFAPLWLVLVGLLNLALLLFWEQSGIRYDARYQEESLFVLNAAALVGWEWFRSRQVTWMQERWWPRIVAAVAFMAITVPAISYVMSVFQNYATNESWVALLLYTIFAGAVFVYYRYRYLDLFMLTMMALSLIGVITAGVARLVDFGDIIMFFVLAIVVIVQAGFAALWLRSIGEEGHE